MYKRRLNEIEYINWTLGQPYNISMSTTVRGNLHEGILRNALDKIQQKLPHTREEIEKYVSNSMNKLDKALKS
ncbi:MAG: hypothetical protein ACFFB1_16805 [Promethearchaeota archaeon]